MLNLKQAQERYPLYSITANGDKFRILFDPKKLNSPSMVVKAFDQYTVQYLDNDHGIAIKVNDLMKLYPSLYFSAHGVWTRKNDADHISVLTYKDFKIDKPDHVLLTKLNIEASRASVEGNFFCSSCKNAWPNDLIYDTVFSGQYCMACAEKSMGIKALVEESKRPGYYD